MNTEPHRAKHPADFQDPTFTPKREEGGAKFAKVEAPPQQKKKDSRDPDWDSINPDIIRLCQRNGMARGCLNLYLEGQLTWMEALETMVTALGKELLLNQEVLVDQRKEYISLLDATKSQKPIEIEEKSPQEVAHEQFFIEMVSPKSESLHYDNPE